MTTISIHDRHSGPIMMDHPIQNLQIQDDTLLTGNVPAATLQLIDAKSVVEIHLTEDHLEFILRCLQRSLNPMVVRVWQNLYR